MTFNKSQLARMWQTDREGVLKILAELPGKDVREAARGIGIHQGTTEEKRDHLRIAVIKLHSLLF